MKKYPSLNGLRAISIIIVIIHHFSYHGYIPSILQNSKWLYLIFNLLEDGQFGVNVFFVISGFLITSLMLKEDAKTATIGLPHFYIRRVLRIFPAYYTLLLFYFIVQQFGYIKISNASWATAITYTKDFNFLAGWDWYTAHGWSLSVEEQFYLLWPIIFLQGDTFRKRASVILFLMVPFLRFFAAIYKIHWVADQSIFTRIDAISIGCFFALYKDELLKKISPYWNIIFYVCIFYFLFFPFIVGLFYKTRFTAIFVPLLSRHATISNVLIALIMMYSIFGPQRTWFKFLNLKLVNYIGLLSYSIYLWQQFFICKTAFWVNQFPQNIGMIIVSALVSYHVIEKPFLSLKSKFSRS
ncbi:acyltransferase family protein [Parasediminibacterium sp. JCM 36343]|uniref:acyltransferase family protein n=1 Tax=Parasediminibacterium sp. JCM 36343 TaxID=3374279 RepID=UPI003978C8C6